MALLDQERSTNSIIPVVVSVMMTAYVFGLSYYDSHRSHPEPEFDFYNTTAVEVHLPDIASEEEIMVQGTFNNIVEGERQTVAATKGPKDSYRIEFQVNSPRPATVYINDEPIQIFLVPDSSLAIHLNIEGQDNIIDSLRFFGSTAGICQYYLDKAAKFGRTRIRSRRNTVEDDSLHRYARKLDSTAIQELAYLLIRATPNELPSWFIDFEKNEILYQKAYLKLANAYQEEIYPGYLDEVAVQNEGAVFSYFYYLYLKTLIQWKAAEKASSGGTTAHLAQSIDGTLAIADTLLSDEVKDVFLTSVIFDLIRHKDYEKASTLIGRYTNSFSRKKYERFLRKQLLERREDEV